MDGHAAKLDARATRRALGPLAGIKPGLAALHDVSILGLDTALHMRHCVFTARGLAQPIEGLSRCPTFLT